MSDKLAGGILAGSTSVSIPFVLRKAADNTEQTGKIAADMTLSYWRQGGTRTAITGSDLAAVNSAYSSGGVKEVDSTNAPGLYRLDVPDAAVATGADWVVISVKVASCYLFHERFALTTNAVQSGDSFARLGAPAGASVSADIAAVKSDSGGIKTKTDSLTFTVAGMVDSNVVDWKGATAPAMTGDAYARLGAPVGASISADVAGVQSDTNDIQTRLPAALVSGRMDASVGAMAAGVVTAAAVATDAIDADAIAADAVTEIQSGLSTLNAAGVRGAVGLASANLDTQLSAVKSDTGAIKTKTDQFVFTKANELDINVKSVNSVTVNGTGSLGDEWGP
jgi:hypothetical protein